MLFELEDTLIANNHTDIISVWNNLSQSKGVFEDIIAKIILSGTEIDIDSLETEINFFDLTVRDDIISIKLFFCIRHYCPIANNREILKKYEYLEELFSPEDYPAFLLIQIKEKINIWLESILNSIKAKNK